MSFTVKQIKAILSKYGVAVENLETAAEEICGRHSVVTDSLKKERDQFRADAESLPKIQKELDELKAKGDDGYKKKYEDEHAAFEKYKGEQTAKETKSAKSAAYRELLKSAGVSEKRIDAILKVSDIDAVELAEDGKVKDAEKLTETIKTEWADFIVATQTQGAQTSNPPANNTAAADLGKLDMKDYIAARKKSE